MATPDASRGIDYDFPADEFRNAIRFVFEMGAPPEPGIGLVFHFHEVLTPTGRADGDRVPFDPRQTVTRTGKAPLSVPCDVEFLDAGEVPTSFGTTVPSKLKVLLLDEDYTQVADASFVVMNGDRYNRDYEPPSFGLFSVGLHTLVFEAVNEI